MCLLQGSGHNRHSLQRRESVSGVEVTRGEERVRAFYLVRFFHVLMLLLFRVISIFVVFLLCRPTTCRVTSRILKNRTYKSSTISIGSGKYS